ncbi:MAG: hypothetical protein C5B55_13180, partial [Blastocatellia bacterium]
MRAILLAVAIAFTGFQNTTTALAIAQAQADPAITAKGAIGEVKSIDLSSKLITIKTDAGSMVMVLINDKTVYKHLAPGEQSLTKATDIAVGDV